MKGVGCVLPHPSSEQVRLITLPFPLPVQQVNQGAPWERTNAFTGHPTQRQTQWFFGLIHSCPKVVITYL